MYILALSVITLIHCQGSSCSFGFKACQWINFQSGQPATTTQRIENKQYKLHVVHAVQVIAVRSYNILQMQAFYRLCLHATHLSWSSCAHHLSPAALSLTHINLVVHSHDTFLDKRLHDARFMYHYAKKVPTMHTTYLYVIFHQNLSLYTLQHLWGCAPQDPLSYFSPFPQNKILYDTLSW